jgi:uncharacterized membrane protein YhaH (DUF805 family)
MNEKKKWFKAKTYGWGWVPATKEGWIILHVYVGVVILRAIHLRPMFDTASSFVFRYLAEVIILTMVFIGICYLTGEKPEWRWGEKKDKKI